MTYRELTELLKEKELPVMATNQDGEPVLIEQGRNEEQHYFKLTTAQHNNWCRTNIFYADGSMDEIYKKDL